MINDKSIMKSIPKTYSISEVANELNLTVYTLRYYDKEGLMPFKNGRPAEHACLKNPISTL
jgi:hypothetical protein